MSSLVFAFLFSAASASAASALPGAQGDTSAAASRPQTDDSVKSADGVEDSAAVTEPVAEKDASEDAVAAPLDCTDVYDSSGGCQGLMKEPLVEMSEPISAGAPLEDEGLLSLFDNQIVNWGLLGLGTAAVLGATAFHTVSFFYAGQLANQARLGQIGPAALQVTSGVQTALGIGAGLMWLTAALLGGSALALWAFDPETGAIRLPFFSE